MFPTTRAFAVLVGLPAEWRRRNSSEVRSLTPGNQSVRLGSPKTGTCNGRSRRLGIRDAISDERLDLLKRNLEYHLQVADVIERYGYDRGLESSELAVIINSGNCGYLEIGEALEALEKEEKGLGAAFYWRTCRPLSKSIQYCKGDLSCHSLEAILQRVRLPTTAGPSEKSSMTHRLKS
jgi:hypothetical protein